MVLACEIGVNRSKPQCGAVSALGLRISWMNFSCFQRLLSKQSRENLPEGQNFVQQQTLRCGVRSLRGRLEADGIHVRDGAEDDTGLDAAVNAAHRHFRTVNPAVKRCNCLAQRRVGVAWPTVVTVEYACCQSQGGKVCRAARKECVALGVAFGANGVVEGELCTGERKAGDDA